MGMQRQVSIMDASKMEGRWKRGAEGGEGEEKGRETRDGKPDVQESAFVKKVAVAFGKVKARKFCFFF